jgi:hypothetical protein
MSEPKVSQITVTMSAYPDWMRFIVAMKMLFLNQFDFNGVITNVKEKGNKP